MRISIFGLGYVGCVSAGCLVAKGHEVIGVDVSPVKVSQINAGKPTIIEKDIDGLIADAHQAGRLRATPDVMDAVTNSELSIIAVGTPSSQTGHLDLNYVHRVAEQIGTALRDKESFHTIAIRSTVLPGTNERIGEIVEAASGKKRNQSFSIISNPEFLREGSAVKDYFHPPYTLIGFDSDIARDMMLEVYKDIPGEKVCTTIPVAEIMKYINNTFHALKVVFGNEVGNICKKLDIDSHEVMDIFCKDHQLNISPYYLKPGFAYGGSCLPKDMKALRVLAADHYVEVPVINSIERSNELQKENALNVIMGHDKHKIGVLGLSFKAGTDDLRNSAMVDVVERLIGKGYEVRIYDANVKLSELTGTNKEFIEARIPHLQSLISSDINEVVSQSDLVVVANKEDLFIDALKTHTGKTVVDLVRLWKSPEYDGVYEGLSWGGGHPLST